MKNQVEIKELITEEITEPRIDGTRGSALYQVPFQLNTAPDTLWIEIFVDAWNHPEEYTMSHRPGIAHVEGDKIILDGTTIDEVKDTHLKTLKYAVETANREIANHYQASKERMEREKEMRKESLVLHRKHVKEICKQIIID